MEQSRIKSLLETLIFVSEGPLKVADMLEAVENFQSASLQAASVELQIEAAELLEGEAEAGAEEILAGDVEITMEAADSEIASEEAVSNPDVASQLQSYAEQEASKIGRSDIQEALDSLAKEYAENPSRGILLTEVAQGWQFRTRPENSLVIRGFYQPKPTKISKPSLETLAIVAYRQPITRVEIDAIRGVDSGGVLKTLLEKNLVRIVGKKDEPGKPMLYGTTQGFLELFQLKNLKDLPTLKEFRELEEEFHRKANQEGVVVENTMADAEVELEKDFSLNASPIKEELAALEAEELEDIESLEDRIKDLRHLEKEIFAEEKAEVEAKSSPEELAN